LPTRYRSDAQPPKAYPELIAARITPIRAPQTNNEFPNMGASSRLPKISSAMTTPPVIIAVKSRRMREYEGLARLWLIPGLIAEPGGSIER
jgi:hypothetical protein